MASSSSGYSIPAPEAVQILVSSLADESPVVRDAAGTALKDIAALSPLLVLDCCSAASRGRKKFGNLSGLFQVMAAAIHAINKDGVGSEYMAKLGKLVTMEIISTKDLNDDWLRAASGVLVSIGLHNPDLMMDEVFLHLSGSGSAVPSMVQILAEFASADAFQFVPRLKGVLKRVLPILGSVKDIHRLVFANAFKSWCEACWQYGVDFPISEVIDGDVMSFLNSAFELLLRVWANSRDLEVRASTVEALGEMVGLVNRAQQKSAIPRLIPIILNLCKRNQDVTYLATSSLHNLLNAALLSETGPPLLDFEDLTITLSTLLPVVATNYDSKEFSEFSVGLKIYNNVQHCFLIIGEVYPEDMFTFLLHKCRSKEESLTFAALSVLKHLLPRLSEAWHAKRPLLVEAMKNLLDVHNLAVRKALSEVIVIMASHCYLVGPPAEVFIEYLLCLLTMYVVEHLQEKLMGTYPTDLRDVCEKGLLLLTVTIPEMEHILWPFLLKMIIPRNYTASVATVCKCIAELCRHKHTQSGTILSDCRARIDIPTPEDLFARLVVLLHNPLARQQLVTQILNVLCHLASLFPKNIILFWQEEIPKMKAYASDPEDLKQDPSYQEIWDDMIINFVAESLDVIQDQDWAISLGNSFAKQYELFSSDDEHSALLHRCLGILLQKLNDRTYVRSKINLMYLQANIASPVNRLGLAKAMGLVAASHLDTVLDKLKSIIDSVDNSLFKRIMSFFSDKAKMEESDDIHAALALMYGYAAKYAPSTVIEARINALVGTNMLVRLLNVRHPIAKQAVITAIDLLGQAVIGAAKTGAPFPLKRRDVLLDYTLTLMGRDDEEGFSESSLELLRTRCLALSACTTLVSVEPKLTAGTRNHILKATLGFFSLPNDPPDVVSDLMEKLITLLCTILAMSGEDGRSRSEQLLHILRQIDPFISSSIEYQRIRGCLAVYKMLNKFRMICLSGYCSFGCQGKCNHTKQIDRVSSSSSSITNLPYAFASPSRDALSLGERIMVYIPRCADTNPDVQKTSAQILDQFFSISLSLPRPSNSIPERDVEMSYRALSALEDVIAILRSDASLDPSEVFNRIVSSVCILFTKDELIAALYACSTAICDKVRQSAEGAIQAVIEFITERGRELNDGDISRTAQSLLSAVSRLSEKHILQETLGAICSLAENTSSRIVFSEVLSAARKDISTKDTSRLRGGWQIHQIFQAFSQHTVLCGSFLEHVTSILNQTLVSQGDYSRRESPSYTGESQQVDDVSAAVTALTAFFRGGGRVGKRAVEQNYSSVVATLVLQLGTSYSLAGKGQLEPLRQLLVAFNSFCECAGDLEMGKILARDRQFEEETWIGLMGELAGCVSIKRPKEVPSICLFLCKALERPPIYLRESAAAALSEFVPFSDRFDSLLEQLVEGMCRHVTDDSPTVRRLCLRGLVQMPPTHLFQYTTQILSVIVALLDDLDESVQLTAITCLLKVLGSAPADAVEPILLNLSVRVRNLQVCMNNSIRENAFDAFGALSDYGVGPHRDTFLEQVHATLPRLILHIHDDDLGVRRACRV
ncbi:hypothetical protein M569_02803, partial [Genlisea aurea]